MPSAQTTVMIARQHNLMSPRPIQMQCPNCNASVVTMTERVTGTMVYALALVLCVVGCFAGCCLLPFFIPELKDVHHYCPTCRYHIGIYKKDFG
ncbi:PREDICTED: lipopolysaccharide-induced tumor necrosis factor-alpha factor homolog [Priapulus caudatus]|uniref:Lipopolysaccharide-induced tumor necrosis factor-alpha factor homolog n=1 Tax=Priapulus caudatus TaxID=37621 RepID=A0ABM1DR13_PRICU|nr:PREDICTED: lipopolysaccharide-induced tumor necrosis factor-alpha factor homolog [Priapulus caudatus]